MLILIRVNFNFLLFEFIFIINYWIIMDNTYIFKMFKWLCYFLKKLIHILFSHLAEEVRENISLKTGAKKSSCFNFSCKDECFGGSKLVIVSFTALTIAITISLIIQIYYGDYQVSTISILWTEDTHIFVPIYFKLQYCLNYFQNLITLVIEQ